MRATTIFSRTVRTATADLGLQSGRAFKSKRELWKFLGNAGDGYEWHHIVEQNKRNTEKFGNNLIQNTDNIVRLKSEEHREVSALYSSLMSIDDKVGSEMTARRGFVKYEFQELREIGVGILNGIGLSVH